VRSVREDSARIAHHLESPAAPHWHIDYLLRVAEPVEVWWTTASQKLERHWAELFENARQFRAPIPRFGASDYHRSRSSHLFFAKRRPAFEWFRRQIIARFDGVPVERCQFGGATQSVLQPKGLEPVSPGQRPGNSPA
jgi:Uri superfamily endonuclease